MSAHFKFNEIGFFPLEQWPVTVCAWRGCCIEVFARAEHSVADCLRALEKAGVATGKDSRHPFAGMRLKSLAACIKGQPFGGHGKTALARIADWERIYAMRAFLAHGEIKATAHGIEIKHITFDGKAEKQLTIKQMTRVEMLRAIAEMEAAQRLLHHQLGQIKAMAAKKKPNPGSSPG